MRMRKPDSLLAGGPRFGPAAFTLVELLVVVAIVALLASLLLSVLVRARDSAQRARCASNARQLTLAAHLYWDDHDDTSFDYCTIATNGGTIYWFGWIENESVGEGRRAFDATRGALYPYLQGRGVEVCPALRLDDPQFKPKARGATYGYGYNLNLFGQKMNRVTRPVEVAVFGDCAQVNTWQAPASPEHPMIEEWYYLDAAWPTAHFRHRGKASVSFVDGHLSAEPPVPGSFDPNLPAQRVGCLPREILEVR